MAKQDEIKQLREACESDLFTFAKYVYPDRYYGDVHKELFRWFQAEESQFQLALVPRDHQKSHCIAVYCAWKLTTKPWWTFLYVSSNPGLAKEQLDVVEQIFKSDRHRYLWPDMLNYVRDRDGSWKHKPLYGWTQDAIRVDHPARKVRQIRDPSVRATSAKSSKTGYHCNEIIFDDLVTDENYGSDAEQEEVIKCYKNCMKIATTGSLAKAVGTRYGDDDLYALITELTIPEFDEDGEVTGEEPMWSVFERVVEDSPNRTGDGNFLWPRMYIPELDDWFGFDARELAIKKKNLTLDGEMSSFYAQYYNDPNDSEMERINRSHFQYMEPKHLEKTDFGWEYAGEKLKLVAAMDLAFSTKSKKRDYTAIAVVGMDKHGKVYVLDLDRFQTDKFEVFYERAIQMYSHWGFRELYVETNNGGGLVAEHIKTQVRKEGGSLEVKGQPAPNDKSKDYRVLQILEPRYRNGDVLHNKIGLIRQLEEELRQPRPKNDDLKDAVAFAVGEIKKPLGSGIAQKKKRLTEALRGSRFGGRRGGSRLNG
jgi:hypothetical protein